MDYLQKFTRQFRDRFFLLLFINNFILLADWYVADQLVKLAGLKLLAALVVVPLLSLTLVPWLSTRYLTNPTKLIAQAILHISPGGDGSPASKPRGRFGRELVTNLLNHLYQLASVVDGVEKTSAQQAGDLHHDFMATALPLPLLVLDKQENIVFVNDATRKYITRPDEDLIGQNVYSVLDLSFSSDHTLDSWLKDAKQHAVTANHTWERVRIGLPGQADSLQFDLAAHYNKAHPLGYETMLVLFDHTEVYSQDDQAMSFVALSVHELRTPLTLLRGYIEVFDEELGPGLDAELQGFMKKMDASAQQLAAFVDNILNVAKIEDNQLTLQLREEQWPAVLASVVEDLSLRAGVRGVIIKTDIAKDLPSVGVDRYSIYEVVANLLDNAIKYCGTTKEIYVTASLNKNGLVETTVKDFGLGIAPTILPHIFDKFYRNHRNRAQIGGTGLGLYLSKSIVAAHGGQIWVSSKENEGSSFSFTVQPFAAIASSDKTGDNGGITRGAHGWIKNHSLYRD